ncbi:hypothetical protein KBA73_02445 [Patescibacteria group bacterium]|nr:hypothetical protein [Patescibacteria group bacterium]
MPFETRRFREIPEGDLIEMYANKELAPDLALHGFDPKRAAVFLDPKGGLELRVVDFHHRSVDQTMEHPVNYKAGEARHILWRVDTKGAGFIKPETYVSKKHEIESGDLAGYPEVHMTPYSKETPWGYDSLGLFDERMAGTTVKKAEELSRLGMRVETFAAYYRLKTVHVGGETITIEELKRRTIEDFKEQATEVKAEATRLRRDGGTPKEIEELKERAKTLLGHEKDLRENFEPVIAIRLMRSIFRIRDLEDGTHEQARIMIEEAVAALQAESRLLHGVESPIRLDTMDGRDAYLKQLGDWFGEGLGVLFRTGQSHLFLHMGNLSLAGEIVDLDSVTKVMRTRLGKGYLGDGANVFRTTHPEYGIPNCLVKDMRDLCLSNRNLRKSFLAHGYTTSGASRLLLADALKVGLARGIGQEEPYALLGVSNQKLQEVFAAIVQRIVINGETMSRIMPDPDLEERARAVA